jgi:hypothetical protein
MESRPIFYYGTIKNMIVAFGSIFDKVQILTDFDEPLTVPLLYAPKEKFVAYFQEKPSFTPLGTEQVLPRMAFELSGLNFAPERFSNPLNRLIKKVEGEQAGELSMFNRIPYDFMFNLYIATKHFEESLKIFEIIAPYFTPELNVSIRDRPDFGLTTDIPITLNTTGFSIDYEGTFETRRVIFWTLSFTAKGWLYGDTKTQGLIKETIVHLTQEDVNKRFVTLISEVIPREAGPDDPHTILDTKIEFQN